ncbi:hypothetical protein [Shewanella sp. SR43-8]|nr:hypothetical protein [Shewanella sp. SR43-8]MBB1320039.1 hypothetical protein [Shewanella sp. SR43-8]
MEPCDVNLVWVSATTLVAAGHKYKQQKKQLDSGLTALPERREIKLDPS